MAPRGRLGRVLWIWGPVAAQMAAIFTASNLSDLPELPGDLSDKTAHFYAYAVLAALAVRAFAGGRWRGVGTRAGGLGFVLSAGYGATDEVHQIFTPGRHPGVDDWGADAIGSAAAVLVVLLAGRWVSARRSARTREV